jgi:hypothetical protein
MVVQSCGKTKKPVIAAIIKADNIIKKYFLIFTPPDKNRYYYYIISNDVMPLANVSEMKKGRR